VRILVDSTTVAVVTSRPGLIPAPHRHPLVASIEDGEMNYAAAALDALRALATEHTVTVYVGAGQVRAASWFRERGFTVGAHPFPVLAADADRVILPAHRDVEAPDALRVPALALHALGVIR